MSNNSSIIDEYGETDDWVEIYNSSSENINIKDYYLTDNFDNLDKWQILDDLIIPANGFQIIWLDNDENQGNTHTNFKLSSSGEVLALVKKEGADFIILDQISFPALTENTSFGRQVDGQLGWLVFGISSPNESNSNNALFYSEQVDFSIESGFYSSNTLLNLSASSPETEIRYTTDGTIPNWNSPIYETSSPIELNETMQVSAAVFKEGFAPGVAIQRFYHIDNTKQIPVLNIQTNPRNLWDDEMGIYTVGTNGTGNVCSSTPRNWNRDWKRKASIYFFESDGNLGFEKEAEIKIGGGCSRNQVMKSFNVFLDEDDAIEYPLFLQQNISTYHRFKLRNSGHDFTQMMFRSGAIQEMLRGKLDIDLLAYRPVAVYVNGQEFGIYELREFFNEDYSAAHHAAHLDSIDMIKNPYLYYREIKEGNTDAWDTLTAFVENNDFNSEENYQLLTEQIDIQEYMNYHISQIYIANYDWPANNMMVWRERKEGEKWRWMLYDLDGSTNFRDWTYSWPEYNSLYHATRQDLTDWPNRWESTLWLHKILKNEAFEHEFSQRTCSVAQIVFDSIRVNNFTDSLAQLIAPEMDAHIDHWLAAPEDWGSSIPSGGSVESWEEYIREFKKFFALRFSFLSEKYSFKFQYPGMYELELNYDASTNGRVVLHQNQMETPYQYKGKYFSEVPIQVEAIPEEEYEFVRWLETNETSSIIHFVANQKSTLTPIFKKIGEISPPPVLPSELNVAAFPNPTSNFLNVNYSAPNIENSEIEIFNILGQLVYKKPITLETTNNNWLIDVKNWAVGTYFLRVRSSESEVVIKVKIDPVF